MCVLEILREPRVDRRRVVGRLEEVDAFGGQQRTQATCDQHAACSSICASARLRMTPARSLGVEAVERDFVDAGAELLQDRGDAGP